MESATKTSVVIQYDPGVLEVLGVFGDNIFIKTIAWEEDEDEDEDADPNDPNNAPDPIDCIVSMPIEEFHRVWDNWIQGKRSHCEFNKMFCGVMGYTMAEEYQEVEPMDVQDCVDEKRGWEWKTLRTFHVTRFEDDHDFERG